MLFQPQGLAPTGGLGETYGLFYEGRDDYHGVEWLVIVESKLLFPIIPMVFCDCDLSMTILNTG
jgi:hypothetical protein